MTPTTSTGNPMHRGLRNRHIQMIALGSAIGTGLFLVSGSTIQTAGPSVLLAYVVAGLVLFLIMRMLGEMAVARPDTSGGASDYAYDYLGRAAGFIVGWNWWFTCIVVSMLELTAAGTFMQFWFPGLPQWVTAAVALVAITGVNLVQVGAFGEFEFWFSLIKVVAIVAMIVFGIAIVLGVGHHHVHGLSNLWSHGGVAPHGLSGLLLSLVAVAISFGGIETLGTAVGETRSPEKTIPRAVNQVLIRILLFYVGAIGIMLIIWPWDEIGTGGSPFVLILSDLGIGGAATVLNVVVVIASLSVCNTMVYSNGRILHSLGRRRQAPVAFARTNSRGVPVTGILVNSGITTLVILFNYLFPGNLLMALVAITVSAEIITWSSIALSHLRFRKLATQTNSFRAPLHPYANYLCLGFFILIVVVMTRIPDSRAGAVTLPLWLLGLSVAYLLQRRFAQRRSAREISGGIVHDDVVELRTGRSGLE